MQPVARKHAYCLALACASVLTCAGRSSKIASRPLELPDGAPGIGFDDLRYVPALHRLLVPAGRSGRVDLVDPDSMALTSITGFAKKADYAGGHDDGPTSADANG